MHERTLIARERAGGPGGLGSIFDEPEPIATDVLVSCGPFEERFPLAGRTIGEVRRMLGPRFDIPPNSQAVLNGQDVDDAAVLQQGQALSFAHRVGEKGSVAGRSADASSARTKWRRHAALGRKV